MGFGVDVAPDLERHRPPVVAHVDVGQVERVEYQLHPGPGQGRVDLVEVAVQGHRGGLGDGAPLAPPKRLAQQPGRGRRGWADGQEPGQRRHPGFRVHPGVVDLLDPGREQGVELGEAAHRGAGRLGAVGDLDQELVAHRFEEPLNFSSAGGPAGLGVGELDPQHRARPAQSGVDEHRPVIHIALSRAPAGSQRGAQCLAQRHRRLGVSPAGRHHRPEVIIEEGDEDRLASGDVRAVQRVSDPAGVGLIGLESAEHRRWCRVGAPPVEPEGGEVALQGAR